MRRHGRTLALLGSVLVAACLLVFPMVANGYYLALGISILYFTVLATAWSDPANAGSGRDEPQLMTLRYGRGRVFHTTLGHDVAAMKSVDFIVTLQRGVEWVATGRVTQPVPANFPGATQSREMGDNFP